MKRFLSILCIVTLLCCALPLSTAAATETRTLTFAQMHGYYRSLGRTVEHNASLYMDNVATGFELYFYGKGDVIVNASVVCSTNVEIAQYLSVYVDGVLSRIRIECESLHNTYDKSITLASGLAEGYHHIEVYRQTEAQVSSFRADSLTFTGRLLATAPEKDLIIDVVGDSISGGYGALWDSSLGVADPGCNHPYYQDGTQSYAFLAGKELGADVRVLQSSGYGCVAGWNGRNVNLQTMYPLLNVFRSQTYLNPFDPLADIVIINLGTNDYSTRTQNEMSNEEFQAGAKNLMQMAKQYNPGATVIWCTGMMGSYYTTEVKAAIAELGGIDAGYHFLELPRGQSGAVSHPNVAQQQAASVVLADYIKANILPADHTSQKATASALRSAVNEAKAVDSPSAILSGAIERAEMELAVGTTDAYRLYDRLTDIRDAMAGNAKTVKMMPKQYISKTPTAADNVSFIWPYYGFVATDGSVSLYKGGDSFYWPQITTKQYETININETPYLRLEFSSTASFNVSLSYHTPSGELAYVNAATLANLSTTDFPAQERGSITVDFASYIREKGHDNDGLVALASCDMYVIGNPDTFVRVYDCAFTSEGGVVDIPTAITGSYDVNNGVLSGVAVKTTAEELIAAMDNSAMLAVYDANGSAVSGKLATGMVLKLMQGNTVLDSAVIAVNGDINCDGTVTSVDARLLLKVLLGNEGAITDAQFTASDMSGDNDLTTGDVRLMLKATF